MAVLEMEPEVPEHLEPITKADEPEEYEIERSLGLGGTDIAALLGRHPYVTPFDLWLKKTRQVAPGQLDPEEDEAALWGLRLECAVGEAYAEQAGRTMAWARVTYRDRRAPHRLASPDLLGAGADERGGADVKTRSMWVRPRWGAAGVADVPIEVACQMQWYMTLTDRDWWDVPVLFGGQKLRIFTVQNDPELGALLLERADRWWQDHVIERREPAEMRGALVDQFLAAKFPRIRHDEREATPEEAELARQDVALRRQIDTLTTDRDAIRNRIRLAIGDAAGLRGRIDGEEFLARWSETKQKIVIDHEAVLTALLRDAADAGESALLAKIATLIDAHRAIKPGGRKLTVTTKKGKPERE